MKLSVAVSAILSIGVFGLLPHSVSAQAPPATFQGGRCSQCGAYVPASQMATHVCGGNASPAGGGGGGGGSLQGQAAYQFGQAAGRALADFLFSTPKKTGPSPEEVEAEQQRQARIAEAQRMEQQRIAAAEQQRIAAEQQRLANIQRAAQWRARMDQLDAEMNQELGGAFDVVRPKGSTAFFGEGGDPLDDTSVVDLRGLSPDPEPRMSGTLLLEGQLRTQSLDAWQAQNTWGGQLPPLASDSRYVPPDTVEQAKNFAGGVADDVSARVISTVDVTGTQHLKGALTDWINKDVSGELDPTRVAWMVHNNDTGFATSTEVLGGSLERRIAGEPTLKYLPTRELFTGDSSALPNALERYATDKWNNWTDVPGQLKGLANDRAVRLFVGD
jgi:hypothetical protein